MRLSNENRETANYARSSKPKKRKSSERGGRGGTEKRLDNEGENRKQEVKECKTCGGKHQGDCWHLITECFVCHNIGHIAAKYPKKFNSRTYLSQTTQAKKRLYYTQKVTQHPNSKTKSGPVLASCFIILRPKTLLSPLLLSIPGEQIISSVTEISLQLIRNRSMSFRQEQVKKLLLTVMATLT